jgi:uncharacterized protein involved in exopolysaccharide biosynthesis
MISRPDQAPVGELTSDDEFDLFDLATIVWRYRALVIAITAAFAIVAGVLAFTATPMYRAEVVVTPVREEAMGALGGLAQQFGGIASLMGVNLPKDASGDARAVLQSRRLVEEFIKRNIKIEDLLHRTDKKATLWLAVKEFRDRILTIDEDARENVTRVVMQWKDPQVAARWANDFVSLANELLRTKALDESGRNIKYINDQLAHTDVVELRRAMYSIIESETKRQMLANGRIEYAFTIVDPAVPPEIRSTPKRTLMLIIGTMIGGIVGVATALLLNAAGQRRHRR